MPATYRKGAQTLRSRACLAAAGVSAIGVLVAGTALTHAGFTDVAHASLGAVGGAYQISLVDLDGQLVSGDPEPLRVEAKKPADDGSAAVQVDVVTTTAVTGLITLTLLSGRSEPPPPDPGIPGPGVDPFEVGLFTVSIDGETLAESVRSADLEPLPIPDWETGVPRTVEVGVRLPDAVGNPYYAGRAMPLFLQFDGRSS